MSSDNLKIILTILCCLNGLFLHGQEQGKDAAEEIIEWPDADNSSVETNANEVMEQLQYFYTHPVNINTATAEDLAQLHLLSLNQIHALTEHREKYGFFVEKDELITVELFGEDIVERLKPFITLSDVHSDLPDIGHIFKRGRQDLICNWQRKFNGNLAEKATEALYLGSPYKLGSRYRFRYREMLRLGITLEKDPGELFFRKNPGAGSSLRAFDYYSGFIHYRPGEIIKEILLGDYHINAGQGLLSWAGFSLGKSPLVLSINKFGKVLSPHSSSREYGFYRGAAIRWAIRKWQLYHYVSHTPIDAKIISGPFSEKVIETIYKDGYHRNNKELARKNTARQTVTGNYLSYENRRFKSGLHLTYTQLNFPFKDLTDRTYKSFSFQGKQLINTSLDYTYVFRHATLFGEFSKAISRGAAALSGINFDISAATRVGILYRRFSRSYQAFYGNAFSESSSVYNEEGIYIGVEAKPFSKLKITAFSDLYSFPWLKFRSNKPAGGKEYQLQLLYTFSPLLNFHFRVKHEAKERNFSGTDRPLYKTSAEKITRIRMQADYQAGTVLLFRTRIENVWYYFNDNSAGFLIFNDVIWKLNRYGAKVSARIAFFDTGSYETRLYAFENDLLYNFSIAPYTGSGSRIYLLWYQSVTDNFDLWVKTGHTQYINKEPDNFELKVQLRLKW